MLDVYSFNAIQRIRANETASAEKLFLQYPYEQYFEKNFNRLCKKNRLQKYKYAYQECYDACQLAYMYSIYQCSVNKNKIYDWYVDAYIKKVMKIYFIAAIVICDDVQNICKENDFARIAVDDYRV